MSMEQGGKCESFCPESEEKLRVREKLLHYFEYKNGQKNVPGVLVKCFARSAAGIKTPKTRDMRTEQCLQRCIEYLLKDIVLDKRKPFHFVYDFIFDRLRAVRQEIIMQEYNCRQTIKVLEPIIMFLSYSRYMLCEEAIDNFDAKICEQHLQECLKRTLVCYDDILPHEMKLLELRRRCFIESIYQIMNIGSEESLKRTLCVPQEIKTDPLFNMSCKISLSYAQGNYYRVIQGLQSLPHVCSAMGALKLPDLRRNIYKIFSHAYNSKLLSVPADFVLRLTAHSNCSELFKDCKYYNIQVLEDTKSLKFQKTEFKQDADLLKCKHESYVDSKLRSIYLPEVLLLRKF